MDASSTVIYLVGCAIKKEIPSCDVISAVNIDEVLAIASRHMISSVVAFALKSAGINNSIIDKAIISSVQRLAVYSHDYKIIKNQFEKAQIWYVPLKGIIIKKLYPNEYMREMADHDILIDESRRDEVNGIMGKLGYTAEFYNVHNEDVYVKAPFLNFEIHVDLFKAYENRKLYEYYHNIKEKLVKDESNHYEYHLTDEDFYLYMIAHEYMHYCGGGTGLRCILDTYVYIKNKDLDMSYIEREARKIGIASFERANRELTLHLFDDGLLTDEERDMLQYMMGSGVFGTSVNLIRNSVRSKGKGIKGKLSYIVSRISIPVMKKNPQYKVYERKYPFFYKYKFLLPLLPIYRLYIASKRTPGRIREEITTIKKNKSS